MINDLVDSTLAEADGQRAVGDLAHRRNIDRWFSFSGMKRSCEYSVEKMNEYKLDDARVEEFPADGRTMVGCWRMMLAWDPGDATLTIMSPASHAGKRLADYKSIPCSLTMWTPGTPKRGVEGEIVAFERGDRDEDYKGVRVKGKFILTSLRGSAVRAQVIKRGALGILSDQARWPHEQPDAVDWMNAWSEDPNGWGLTAGEKTILGFNMSHRRGRELRALIAKGPVRVRAFSNARNYPGVLPVATGVIKGTSRDEVLTLGHGAEQGAVDNASGCATMLEALRILKVLIDAGKLPRPKRSIRMLISWEVYGTLAFFDRHRGLARRTTAGLCIDSVAQKQTLDNQPLGLYRNPHSNASCVDTLLAQLAEKTWPAPRRHHHWYPSDFSSTDNIIAHPSIGIPTPWLGILAHRCWHTNEDTVDKIDPEALGQISALTAAYLYFLANAGEREAAWLADATSADWRMQLARAGVDLSGGLDGASSAEELSRLTAAAVDRVEYLRLIGKKAILSARRYAPKRSAPLDRAFDQAVNMLNESATDEREHIESTARDLAETRGWRLDTHVPPPSAEMKQAAEMIVERAFWGSLAFDGIPKAKCRGIDSGRWGGALQTVLMWCNGKRTLAEAIRLTSQESRRPVTGLVEQIKRCAKLGLVRIRKA